MTGVTRIGTDGLTVGIVSDEAEFAGLKSEWRTLASANPAHTVFQSWEWNSAWWKHYGRSRGRRLHIVTFRDPSLQTGSDLVGLAPLMVGPWYGTLLRRLTFLGPGVSDYGDLLAAPGAEGRVAAVFLGYLRTDGRWTIADFPQLRDGGIFRRYISGADGFARTEVEGEACPYIALPETWDALLQRLGKKTRSNIGYYDRALRKVYEVVYRVVDDPAELPTALDTLFALHQRRWNLRWLPGVFVGRRIQAFHRDAAKALLEGGHLRLHLLELDGEVQAALYCFAFGDRHCYYQGGFEPTLSRWSLGTLLTAKAIETAIGEGKAVFDFLRGNEPYKAKWTSTAVSNERLALTRPGAFAALVRSVVNTEADLEVRAKLWMSKRYHKP